jgi:hypothetical protein
MRILQERNQLAKVLAGRPGFLGVRVRLGHPARLCIDVSRDVDVPKINETVRKEGTESSVEIVRANRRHMAKALQSVLTVFRG